MIKGLNHEIEEVKQGFLKDSDGIQSLQQLKELRDKYLGRKQGIVTSFFSRLKDFPPTLKPAAGALINALKNEIEIKLTELERGAFAKKKTFFDPTLPAVDLPAGHIHILSIILRKVEDIFMAMGYHIAYGPEAETEFHNFTALNIPEYHPTRDEHDTLYLKDIPGMILRTHTSPVQIRYMLENKPPLKIISPGKAFRKDEPNSTHSPVFQQIEGLVVDKGIHFSHLQGTLSHFIRSFFGPDIKLRFRPGYFPFTEPSAEVDMSCFLCFGRNPACKICKGTGWLEILGSGMVHPQVLRNCQIDPEEYSGFAFGMGLERIVMLKYGIDDIRIFYENDLRFIEQVG